VLRFGARDKHARSNAERKTVKLGRARYVLDRFALIAAFKQGGVKAGFAFGKFFFQVGNQPGFVFLEEVKKESLRVGSGAVWVRTERQA
jgi:hypothetical protein